MLLVLKGIEFSNHIAEEVALLTGKSFLLPQSFVYDRDRSVVVFLIERTPLLQVRRRLFGAIEIPDYDTGIPLIRTRVTVGAVATVDLANRYETTPDQIPVVRGILLSPKGVTISSVAEKRGDPFYDLHITTLGMDLTIEDVKEAPAGHGVSG